MKKFSAALALLFLSACALIPDIPGGTGDAAAQGTPVGIGQPVWSGDAILTPLSVVEDSRCAENARCVWAGRLTVSTRVTSTHLTQTADLTLGEPHEVLGRTYVLVSGTPEKRGEAAIPVEAFRFTFEQR